MTELLRPVNWNRIEDPVDKDVWDRLTTNFWIDTKIPLSNDLPSWRTMTPDEQDLVMKVFAGLTLLDTVQGTFGAPLMIPDALTPHEEAVLGYITFNEHVHAKSYSSIFSTLADTPRIDAAFEWSETNEYMQYKANRIANYYKGDDPLKRKSASVVLESVCFFAGFYTPFYFSARGKITNTGDIISLILRDEAIHQYYIGYKYQRMMDNLHLSKEVRQQYEDEFYDFLMDIMDNEFKYTETLYDPLGLTADVKAYLKYNANRALMALGYQALYPRDETKFDAAIMAYMDPTSNQNHDFFSGSGSSYQMIDASDMSDDDWNF